MQITPISNNTELTEIHRAGWVVIDSETQIQNAFVKIEKGVISEVGKWKNKPDGKVIDHGTGVIFPSLVNVHTHLELCALKGHLTLGKSFKQWVRELLYLREKTTKKDLRIGAKRGAFGLIYSGCFVVGEIATLGFFEEDFRKSELEGVYFQEYLGGLSDELIEFNKKDDFIKALAGHAPHTTSPDLLLFLKKICQKKEVPFSIHLAESEEEVEFIKTGKGEWADFLIERNIDFSSWVFNRSGSVSYLDSLGILDEKTIAVHLVRAEERDYEILKKKNVNVCLCLRSNNNLHKKLPDVLKMYNENIHLCLGTDSLASTQSLSIIDEMRFMNENFPQIPPNEIFKMGTINGAEALGVSDRFGTIEKHKSGKLFYMHVEAQAGLDVYSSLMRNK